MLENLIAFVEEESMEAALTSILPKLIPKSLPGDPVRREARYASESHGAVTWVSDMVARELQLWCSLTGMEIVVRTLRGALKPSPRRVG